MEIDEGKTSVIHPEASRESRPTTRWTRLVHTFRRLTTMAPAELLSRGVAFGWSIVEEYGYTFRDPGRNEVAFDTDAKVLGQWLPPTGGGARDIARTFLSHHPQVADELMARVDDILRGKVELLGLGPVAVGNPPRWTEEPVSGLSVSLLHWRKVPFLDEQLAGDHKIVWELNRHWHLVTLAQGCLLGSDGDIERSAIREQFASWISENPRAHGINWASSLEVALRSIAWCWVLRLLGPDHGWLGTIRDHVYRSLWEHGLHLERHLSTYFSPNTHLTGEALGLAYLSRVFSKEPKAQRWAQKAKAILANQIELQILDDGVYFENSVWYHRYTVDIYAHALLVLPGLSSNEQVIARFEKAVHHLRSVMKPDLSAPQIGDDDGGQLLRLTAGSVADFGPTVALAEAVLEMAGGSASTVGNWSDSGRATVLWMGLSHSEIPNLVDTSLPVGTTLFERAGMVVARSEGGKDASWLLFDAGPHGGLTGGHAHADALSCEIVFEGASIVADPGTGAYAGADRTRLRSTQVHATVSLNDGSNMSPSGPFAWKETLDGRLVGMHEDERLAIYAGTIGWPGTSSAHRHERIVIVVREPHSARWQGIVVADNVLAEPGTLVTARWPLASSLSCEIGSGWCPVRQADRVVAHYSYGGAGISAGVVKLKASPLYGKFETRDIIELRTVVNQNDSAFYHIWCSGAVEPASLAAPRRTVDGSWEMFLDDRVVQVALDDAGLRVRYHPTL